MKIPSRYKIWRYPLLLKMKYFFKRLICRDSVNITYWINANTFLWSTRITPYNWGDYVNLKLAKLISGKDVVPSQYVSCSPKIAMMGSILPWAMDKDTIVWGSGCLNSHDPMWVNIEKPIKVSAVRGPLTRKVLIEHGIDCPEVYGDPALCFPRYYRPKIQEKHKIGIIPHVSNLSEDWNSNLGLPNNAVIINPCNFTQWNEFIDQIVSCEIIFSASLHGLIIADTYGIPNVWVSISGEEHPDNNFKFHDYFLSVGKDIASPIVIKTVDFDNIEKYVRAWQKPQINIEKLLEVCPIYKK